MIYVAQPYGGMDPAQMEGFITNYYEYHFLYINGIEHVESQDHPGRRADQAAVSPRHGHGAGDGGDGLVREPRARLHAAGDGAAVRHALRRGQRAGGQSGLLQRRPELQLKDLQDAALFKVRPLFATLPGVSAPPPFGGSPRTIVVSVDPDRLRAYNMSPDEVVAAVTKGNTISPSGNVRIGDQMPMVPINSVVTDVEAARRRPDPHRTARGRSSCATSARSTTRADIQTGYALVNGRRTVYIPVTKRADASTLTVVNLVKQNLPKFQSVLPRGREGQLRVRPVALCDARDLAAWPGRAARRGADRADGAAVPARLAQRAGRRAEHPAVDRWRRRWRCGSAGRRSTS